MRSSNRGRIAWPSTSSSFGATPNRECSRAFETDAQGGVVGLEAPDNGSTLEGPAPKVARLLEGAEEDLLGFYDFPHEHWPKLRSTNPLERLNREIGRRSDVVGIYPNDQALLRLAGMVLLEQNDEWLVGRRYLSETSMRRVLNRTDTAAEVLPVQLAA